MKRRMFVVIAILVAMLAIVQGCGKEEEKADVFTGFETEIVESELEEDVEMEEIESFEFVEKEADIAVNTKPQEYEIQIFASQKATDLDAVRSELQKLGFKTKTVKKVVNGENWYRLRLSNIFNISDAKKIGDEIKSKIASIDDVWIQKVL